MTRSINKDFPDINHHAGPNVISGFICVPLSPGGEDFIAFLRKSQEREIVWAGRANKSGTGAASMLPRQSFEAWTETISGVSKEWTPDQLETAGVITLVYGRVRLILRRHVDLYMLTKTSPDLSSSMFGDKRKLQKKRPNTPTCS